MRLLQREWINALKERRCAARSLAMQPASELGVRRGQTLARLMHRSIPPIAILRLLQWRPTSVGCCTSTRRTPRRTGATPASPTVRGRRFCMSIGQLHSTCGSMVRSASAAPGPAHPLPPSRCRDLARVRNTRAALHLPACSPSAGPQDYASSVITKEEVEARGSGTREAGDTYDPRRRALSELRVLFTGGLCRDLRWRPMRMHGGSPAAGQRSLCMGYRPTACGSMLAGDLKSW